MSSLLCLYLYKYTVNSCALIYLYKYPVNSCAIIYLYKYPVNSGALIYLYKYPVNSGALISMSPPQSDTRHVCSRIACLSVRLRPSLPTLSLDNSPRGSLGPISRSQDRKCGNKFSA